MGDTIPQELSVPVSLEQERGLSVPKVAILTGGFDKSYAFGLSMALAARGVTLDVVGSDDVDCPEMHCTPGLRFINIQSGWQQQATFLRKLLRVLVSYGRLLRYAVGSQTKVFHILWNGRFAHFDRTLLTLFYRMLGKRVAFTAHNVNTAKRDGTDSWLNRLTLKAQYRLVDCIFVHTRKMKQELISEYGVRPESVCVIPFGINNAVPHSRLSPAEAKRRLGVAASDRTVLFFGRIQPYKGLDYLVGALERLAAVSESRYRLVIAGEPQKEHAGYWSQIRERIDNGPLREFVVQRIEYVPDVETELYFKAADAVILPYTGIYQSGVLFLGYSFGLPVIATNVGSFEEEIVAGETGLICKRADPEDLARVIQTYFASPLYAELETRRPRIQDYARARYSWSEVAELSLRAYAEPMGDYR